MEIHELQHIDDMNLSADNGVNSNLHTNQMIHSDTNMLLMFIFTILQ